MNLFRLLQARASAGKPVRVALIGAGKFGSMFLAQVPHTPGLEVPIIVDIDRDRAREACRTVGWDAARIAATVFTDDGARAIAGGAMDVVVEATGNPAVGIKHARAAIAAGKHIVMSTSKPTCWRVRCSPRKHARLAWSIRSPMATSRR